MSPMSKDEPISSRVDTIAVYGSSTKAYKAVLLIHYLDIVNLIIIHHLFYINNSKSVYQQI